MPSVWVCALALALRHRFHTPGTLNPRSASFLGGFRPQMSRHSRRTLAVIESKSRSTTESSHGVVLATGPGNVAWAQPPSPSRRAGATRAKKTGPFPIVK